MKRFVGKMNGLLDTASLILISIMVVLVWAQVFMRYVLNFSPFWIEATARYLMIWALLLSATVLVRRDEHVRMDLIIQAFPPGVSKAIGLILSLAIFVFLLVYTVFGLEAALDNLNVRDGSIRISMFWPLLIIPISGALMFLNLVILIYEVIFNRSDT